MEAVEQVTQAQEPQAPVEPPPLSVADHAKVYGAASSTPDPDAPDGETPAEKAVRLHHSAEQKREKETGKFEPGKVRHRAKSQQATPEDAPRIQQLTARAKTAEERLMAAERELSELKARHASPAVVKQAEQKVEQATVKADTAKGFTLPEPKEADYQDYGEYLSDRAVWKFKREQFIEKQAERQQAAEAKKQEASQAVLKSFNERVTAAQAEIADFEAVAFGPTRIPADSVIDAFIMEDDSGPKVLYHLNRKPELVTEILALPPLSQIKRLVAIATELSPSSAQAGTTGSAARRVQPVVLPTPPNPVRTEAQRESSGPPPTDGTLPVMKHRKTFAPKGY